MTRSSGPSRRRTSGSPSANASLAERAQLEDRAETARVAAAATLVLRRHITPGEFDDVLAQLPSDIRAVLETG